ncbi:hypothetical protein ACFVUN_23590 [Kitasatospora griseola]|uniref:hypothetical protein n=1 Tax=Kitasatospora griseola TaxID=2064 RepID=UPI0036DA2F76
MQRARSVRWAGAVALVSAVVGCTTPHRDRALPAPTASAPTATAAADCAYPRYEFTPDVRTETLTYVTPVVTLTAPDGGPVDFSHALAVRPLTATAVSSAGDADARNAYDAFVRQSRTPGLPEFGKPLKPYSNPTVGVGKPGRFLGYAFNWVITSSFVRHCAGTGAGRPDAVGSVTSFQADFPLAGTVNCAEPAGESGREAARLMCGTDA